jgi:hypothetical protein
MARMSPIVMVGILGVAVVPDADAQVSYWAAEGNALDHAGPNHGSLHNGVVFGSGPKGQSFGFTGTSYVQAPTIGLPTGNQNRTLFLWFNVTSNIAQEAFFAGYGGFGTSQAVYELVGINNRLVFSQWGTGITGGTFGLGEWHTAAVTNVGNFTRLYLDGIQVASGNLPINTSAGSDFYMGRIPGTLGDIRRLNGFVDEVRVFDRALSSDEIIALGSMPPVPEPSQRLAVGVAAAIWTMARCRRRRARIVYDCNSFNKHFNDSTCDGDRLRERDLG